MKKFLKVGCFIFSFVVALGLIPSCINAASDGAPAGYLRFIDFTTLNTLDPNSKWQKEELYELLEDTLSEDLSDSSNCEQVWHFKAKDIKKTVRPWCLSHDKSQETNEAFLIDFADFRDNE